jgi:hypothetical protein
VWAILTDPGHAESFVHLGEAYAPMRRLVELLAERPYADEVFAFKSIATFVLTTAPSYQQAPVHDEIAITFHPALLLFRVGYCVRIFSTAVASDQMDAIDVCEGPDVLDVIDRYSQRLLLLRQVKSEA